MLALSRRLSEGTFDDATSAASIATAVDELLALANVPIRHAPVDQHSDHVTLLEARTAEIGVRLKLESPKYHGMKHVHLDDSFALAQALDKMRSTNHAMLDPYYFLSFIDQQSSGLCRAQMLYLSHQ